VKTKGAVAQNLENALRELKSGDFAAAEARLLSVRAVAPNDPNMRNLLGAARSMRAQAAERAGDMEAAVAAATAALEIDPNRAEAHETLCRAAARNDHVAAARHALAAWRLKRNDEQARANLWQLFTHMGEAQQAETLEAQATGSPDDCVLAVAAANALRRAGSPLRAERLYRAAAVRHPDVSFINSRLACLCVEQGRLEEADALFCAAAAGHGGRDVVTRTAPVFMDALRAGPAPTAPSLDIVEGAAVAGAQTIVYVACDDVYRRTFVPAMLRSLAQNAALDCAVVLHIVNPTDDPPLADLTAGIGPERFVVARERVDLAPFGAQAKTWYACTRFLQLPELIKRWGKPILMLDADLMAIRPLAPLLEMSAHADIGLMSHALKRADIWSLTYADVLHVNPTPGAMDYLDLTRRYVAHFLKPGNAHWFLDQAAMAGALLGGYRDRPAPRIVWYPQDIHSSNLMVDGATGEYWTDPSAYFYSVRATAGGARTVGKALRRAGTVEELQRSRQTG
jgi:tetratricopeptide (TPR) repeat protein